MGGDEAIYLTLADGIAEGRYRDDFLAGTPPHRRYPPGTPAWIAAIGALAGPEVDAVRLANLLLWLGAALLVGDALRRLAGPWAGVVATAAVAANPALSRLAPTALSDVPFMAIAVLTAWAMLRASAPGAPRGFTGLAIAGAAAGFLVRTPGLALCAAVIGWAAWQRRWRATAAALGISAAVVVSWFTYTAIASPAAPSGASGYSYDSSLRAVGTADGLVQQVIAHAVGYGGMIPGEALHLPAIPGTAVDNIGLGFLLAVSLAWGFVVLMRRWSGALLFVGAYVAMLLIWPWLLARLLVPVIPFLVATVVAGTTVLAAGRPGRERVGLLLLAAVLVLPGLVGRWQAPRPAPSSYAAGIRTLGGHLAPGTTVGSWRPPVVYRLSGFRGIDLSLDRRRADGALTAGVLFLGDTSPSERRFVATVLAPRCRELRVVAALPSPNLLLAAGGEGEGGDACQAIDNYRSRPAARGTEE